MANKSITDIPRGMKRQKVHLRFLEGFSNIEALPQVYTFGAMSFPSSVSAFSPTSSSVTVFPCLMRAHSSLSSGASTSFAVILAASSSISSAKTKLRKIAMNAVTTPKVSSLLLYWGVHEKPGLRLTSKTSLHHQHNSIKEPLLRLIRSRISKHEREPVRHQDSTKANR